MWGAGRTSGAGQNVIKELAAEHEALEREIRTLMKRSLEHEDDLEFHE